MGEAAKNLNSKSALEMFKAYEHFAKCMLDAYAVFDAEGNVVKCNPMFSQLLGKKTKQILKEGSTKGMLSLSVAGKPLEIFDLVHSAGPTRVDEVTAETESASGLNLIVGVYPFEVAETKVTQVMDCARSNQHPLQCTMEKE